MFVVFVAAIGEGIEELWVGREFLPALLYLEPIVREARIIDDVSVVSRVELTESNCSLTIKSFSVASSIKCPFAVLSVDGGEEIKVVIRYL